MSYYDFKAVEKKWQDRWGRTGCFHAQLDTDKPKFMHLWNFRTLPDRDCMSDTRPFTALDIIARKKRMQGLQMFCYRWVGMRSVCRPKIMRLKRDSPRNVTNKIIYIVSNSSCSRLVIPLTGVVKSTRQIPNITNGRSGYSFSSSGMDWHKKKNFRFNFCTSCKVGLANEEVVNGVCERCGGQVVRKVKNQWMLKITEYAQRLIDDLDTVDT
jgi:leucyl-tRNA synthetase